MTTWTKLEDGTWGVRVEGGDFPVHMVGMPYVVTSKSGEKKTVVLGGHVRGWMVAGGRHVDIYRVAA